MRDAKAVPAAPAARPAGAPDDPDSPPDTVRDAPRDPAQQRARQALAALDQIDVPDAGLVLLWPFIEPLFRHCGLLDAERRFVDAQACTRGVLLLAQLSWPEPDPAEPRLALAKLLCGLEPDAPFEPEAGPSPDEAAACADLLQAALAHAASVVPAFDRLGVAGLQTRFVQRAGLLGARHGSWLLQPQRHAEDVLLERLPWGWAWVRLPWMPHPLQVQW